MNKTKGLKDQKKNNSLKEVNSMSKKELRKWTILIIIVGVIFPTLNFLKSYSNYIAFGLILIGAGLFLYTLE